MRALSILLCVFWGLKSLNAQVPSEEEFYKDPLAGFQAVVATFRNPQLSRSDCVQQLSALRTLIGSIDGTKLGIPGSATDESNANLRSILGTGSKELQVLRFNLIQMMHDYHAQQPLSRAEADEFKATIRVLRTLDERMAYYIRWILDGGASRVGMNWFGSWKSRNDRLPRSPEFILNARFAGGLPSEDSIVVSDAVDLDSIIEDGDLVLTLGDGASEVSQLIMNISSGLATDSDFSHVYSIRKKGGKIFKIEALIEDGTHFRSWEEFKKKRYARFVIMRFRDRKVATAGQDITESKIRYIKDVLKRSVIYNARMEALQTILALNNNLPVRLNCLQTAECIWIFGHEAAPPHSFPQYPTIISHRDPYVLDQMTIPNNIQMPHPGDLNSEPVLAPVLEYRDPLLTHQAFLGRVILTFILKKTTEEGYRIRPNWFANLAKNVLWPIRRYSPEWLLRMIPGLRKLEKAFDQDMDRQLLAFSLMLKNVVERMFPAVLAQEQAFVSSNASRVPSNFDQAMKIVEAVYASNVKNVQYYLYSPTSEDQLMAGDGENRGPRTRESINFFHLFIP